MELFDICDENGRPTGKIVERETAHKEGVRHRTAHVWILRKEDNNWQILLQKRSQNKDSFPGLYDTSSAGHIPAGDEPLESALRELEEELGITAQPEQLHFAGTFRVQYAKEFHGRLFKDNEVIFVYIYQGVLDINDIVIQETELEEVRWFDLQAVYEECRQGKRDRFCVPTKSLEVLQYYLQETG